MRTKLIEKVNMDENSLAIMVDPRPDWIDQADCIDMDCGIFVCMYVCMHVCMYVCMYLDNRYRSMYTYISDI